MKHGFSFFLPLMASLLLAMSVPARAQDNAKVSLRTVVIDAGHGGKDPGCISRDKKTYEKTIALDIATRLRDKIKAGFPTVNVVLTREDDTFIPLDDRAAIANSNNGDLFISIHVNAVDRGAVANGYSIHCLGQSQRQGNDLFSKNLSLIQRENSVIKLEDDYQVKYQGFDPSDPQSYILFSLMQNAHLEQSLQFASDVADAMGHSPIRNSRGISQDPFLVLWRTTMPSVLIEVGFITNPDDLTTLKSEKGRDDIAANIYKAFRVFKKRYDGTVEVPAAEQAAPAAPEPAPAVQEPAPAADATPAPQPEEAVPAPSDAVRYGTQVLATGKELALTDPFFKGNAAVAVRSGKLIRYFVGVSTDLDEARKNHRELRKIFPDSFLVKIEGETTTRVK